MHAASGQDRPRFEQLANRQSGIVCWHRMLGSRLVSYMRFAEFASWGIVVGRERAALVGGEGHLYNAWSRREQETLLNVVGRRCDGNGSPLWMGVRYKCEGQIVGLSQAASRRGIVFEHEATHLSLRRFCAVGSADSGFAQLPGRSAGVWGSGCRIDSVGRSIPAFRLHDRVGRLHRVSWTGVECEALEPGSHW